MGVIAEAVPVGDWDDYLALEARTGERHELVEGVAYAMVGGTEAHNLVAMNLAAALHGVRGPCRVFQQGMKLRIRTATADNFFYPDVMLCCDPADDAPGWKERPRLIAEVLSPSTERVDLGEKLLRYQAIPGLVEYLAIQSVRAEAFVFRAGDGWRRRAADLDAGLALESADLALDFDLLYAGVSF